MSETFDILFTGGTCATPAGIVETDIGVRGGRIAAIGDLANATAAETFDASGLHLLPGVVDSQVHFREPGLEHKEDFATGTAAAALGGVTAVFEMPNTNPSTTTAADLADKCRRAKGRAWVDMAFYVGAAAENVDDLDKLELLPGAAGVKIFMGSSTGNLLVEDDATLAQVLAHGKRRCAIHCEDEPRLRERLQVAKNGGHPKFHPEWRDVGTALRATERLIRLARGVKRRVHVLHVSTAEEMEFLRDHHDFATVEATPQHLTLAGPEAYERLGTFAQMNPPIRDERHRDALWQALQQGLVDVIGSDHAPHTREEKDGDYPATPSGMPGVQTLVPLMLNHVNEGRLSLERFVDLTSAGAQRIFGVQDRGRIALGYEAHLTIVDLKAKRRITNQWIASRCGWTPFDGMQVTGWPVATVLRGEVVMREGQLIGDPAGGSIKFLEAM